MKLHELLKFESVSVQCHDNPDPDALASALGLYEYFKYHNKTVRLFYSGRNEMSKPNLLEMTRLLEVPLEYIPKEEQLKGLLITVDCQYGAGNVTKFEADAVAVIDHHMQEVCLPEYNDIRPYLGSCSTLVWKLLTDEGFVIDHRLGTALYYGLYADTGAFSEIRHPLDRDLRDSAVINERAMKLLKNSNLSLEDLALASSAIKDLSYEEDGRFALVRTEPCDPNILGFISDLAMQVDKIDIAVAFSESTDGIKYSVRTVIRETKAADIASWLAKGLGSGGGHAEKAGGYISMTNFRTKVQNLTVNAYFHASICTYLNAYTIADNLEQTGITLDSMGDYEKQAYRIAYVVCRDHFPDDTVLHIRMLEGDISIKTTPEIYIMIGLEGEVYPIEESRFNRLYTPDTGEVHMDLPYSPSILVDMGARVALESIAKPCISRAGERIKAIQLEKGVKLFTRWDTDSYVKGEPGDWMAAKDFGNDVYFVRQDLFPRLYKEI